MNSKARAWITLIAAVLIFGIIVVSVGSMFSETGRFLTPPGIDTRVENLSMNIEGKVNGKDFFNITYLDGNKVTTDNDLDLTESLTDEMRFTTENQVITLDMSFKNISTASLYLEVSGIYLDKYKYPTTPRFETTAYRNDAPYFITEQADGKGVLRNLTLEPLQDLEEEPSADNGTLVKISLVYTLNLTQGRPINNEEQKLIITISETPFE